MSDLSSEGVKKMATSGLEELVTHRSLQDKIKGNVAYLCHSASIDRHFTLGVYHLQKIFGPRLVKIFGPQHGFVTDVQDNMIETQDFIHPYFKIPILSLYGKTRIPTPEMLKGVDTLVIDLQDVGTRVYTYINTMTLAMEACGKQGIKVVVLDRPNPVGGNIIEGNLLEKDFTSFVGRHPIPQRHALTMGEMAIFAKKFQGSDCELEVVMMKDWTRKMFFKDTGLPWVLPSPNLPTMEGALTFVGTVLFEGTNISEGRGTTRSLEIVGHPKIEAFGFYEKFQKIIKENELRGFELRPLMFMPTFQKHAGKACGGFQIHPTHYEEFRPWTLCQLLCQFFYHELGTDFAWKTDPYEYEFNKLAIDLINGTDEVRYWVEQKEDLNALHQVENLNRECYLSKRSDCLIYN